MSGSRLHGVIYRPFPCLCSISMLLWSIPLAYLPTTASCCAVGNWAPACIYDVLLYSLSVLTHDIEMHYMLLHNVTATAAQTCLQHSGFFG